MFRVNKMIAGILPLMPEKLVWLFSSRYIAGQNLSDALDITRQLNAQGMQTTIDLLGEFLMTASKIDRYKSEYERLIDTSAEELLDNSFSVKPTMFGLLIDRDLCYLNLHDIVSKAVSHDRFVRIDMEDSQCTDRELELFRRLHAEFPGHVGIVLQACLKRTMDDLNMLAASVPYRDKLNIRICKGIYDEAPAIAYKKKEDVSRNFLKALEFMIGHDMFAAIATHDKKLVEGAYRLISRYKVRNDRYEFQMLYGVTPELRRSVVESGHRMRVYVPYGKEWFNYSLRRLRENPRMISHIIKALFVRR